MNNANKPAFPVTIRSVEFIGLTKREYFAAMAMQGLITGITKFREDLPEIIVFRPKSITEIAVTYADALLKELESENE